MAETNAYIQYYRKGVELYAAGHYDEALTNLKKSRHSPPRFSRRLFQNRLHLQRVREVCGRVFNLRKSNGSASQRLGTLLGVRKNLVEIGRRKKGIPHPEKGDQTQSQRSPFAHRNGQALHPIREIPESDLRAGSGNKSQSRSLAILRSCGRHLSQAKKIRQSAGLLRTLP